MEKLWKMAVENGKVILVIVKAFEIYGDEWSASRVGHFNPRDRSPYSSE
jgi:hypothetical protein